MTEWFRYDDRLDAWRPVGRLANLKLTMRAFVARWR